MLGGDVKFGKIFELGGEDMYRHACDVGLEGVVSKVRDEARDPWCQMSTAGVVDCHLDQFCNLVAGEIARIGNVRFRVRRIYKGYALRGAAIAKTGHDDIAEGS